MMPSTKSSAMTDISTLCSVIKNVTSITTSVEEDSQYLFKTLNGYQVTTGTLIFNLSVVILGIWIIILNCLLIQTLVKYRAYLEVTDIFIHNLAATDATTGLLLIYNSTYNILNFQNRYECLIRFGLIQSMSLCSNGFIAMLTINRYIMVSRPFRYRQIFKKKLMVSLTIFTWCLSIAVGFLPLIGWNQDLAPQPGDNMVCRFFGIMDPHYLWLNVGLYWLPVFLMLVLYTHMSKIACNHAKAIKANERAITNKEEKAFDRHSWKLTKTVSIVIGVYLFCWMPTGGSNLHFTSKLMIYFCISGLTACHKRCDLNICHRVLVCHTAVTLVPFGWG